MKKVLFQCYKAPVTTLTSGRVADLKAVYDYIVGDPAATAHTTQLRDLLLRVQRGELKKEVAKEYKSTHFDYACFSGTFRHRSDAGLFAHSGLLCLDLDHVGPPQELESLRQRLLADPCFPTLMLFTSPSGDGLKWVIAIDLAKADHPTWFRALQAYVSHTYGYEVDGKCGNVSRACFLPHDARCYLHPRLADGGSLPMATEPFCPSQWAARREPSAHPSVPATSQSTPQPTPATPQSVAAPTAPADSLQQAGEAIRYYADYCVSHGIDLTAGYDNWLTLGFALCDIFNEGGRSIYHDLSRLNGDYKPAECDRQYTNCLRSRGSGVTYRSFFALLQKAGVDLKIYPRNRPETTDFAPVTEEMAQGVCAKSAKVPYGTNPIKNVKNEFFDVFETKGHDGTMSFLSSMALSQSKTFSDKIDPADWPFFCRRVMEGQTETVDRDKMLLATLNVVSGLLPESLYSLYDGRRIYAAMYIIFYGGFATRKGELEACRQLITPLKQEMQRNYEEARNRYEEEVAAWENSPKATRGKAPCEPQRRSPLIAANSSASAVYRMLDANGGFGLMYETEADSLTNMLSRSEYGDYSDLLRKAHHHELCSMVRVTEKIHIELERPRLSVLLTCTGSQLPLLLPPGNVANGLASRFLFYALPDGDVTFRNVFEKGNLAVEDSYLALGKQVLALYHALMDRREQPLQFMLTNLQQERFVTMFNDILREQYDLMGNGIQGYIFRLALECFRYTMVLTALRRLSERYDTGKPIFDDDEQALLCDERDFRIATTLIECLVNHTARVYAVIGTHEEDPFCLMPETPPAAVRRLYEQLPCGREFTTAEAVEIAVGNRMSERHTKRILGDLVTKYLVLDRPHRGVYVKLGKEAVHE